jgi:hypothetical protein
MVKLFGNQGEDLGDGGVMRFGAGGELLQGRT